MGSAKEKLGVREREFVAIPGQRNFDQPPFFDGPWLGRFVYANCCSGSPNQQWTYKADDQSIAGQNG